MNFHRQREGPSQGNERGNEGEYMLAEMHVACLQSAGISTSASSWQACLPRLNKTHDKSTCERCHDVHLFIAYLFACLS